MQRVREPVAYCVGDDLRPVSERFGCEVEVLKTRAQGELGGFDAPLCLALGTAVILGLQHCIDEGRAISLITHRFMQETVERLDHCVFRTIVTADSGRT